MAQIQSKMDQAKTRREQLEQEQLEKLRNHVSSGSSSYISLFVTTLLLII
jgi:hypothetical protein